MANSILRLPEVENRTGYKRSSIYQKARDGEFPKPIPLGARAVGWLESEIEQWISERVEKARANTPRRRYDSPR